MSEAVSARFPYKSHFVDVGDAKMHYIEQGMGDPILFLHGIPTSSYLWRNLIPSLSKLGRCIAPDLIGMGKSSAPNIEFSVFDHIKYIEKFIAALNLSRITLVMHDWGSVIGFDYAMRNEAKCKGLVFYEAYLRPLMEGDELSLPYQEQVATLENAPDVHDLILNSSYYVDKVMPQTILGKLGEEEMAHYREPFLKPGAGKPICQYLKELPKGDGKSKVDKLIAEYSKKLTQSKLPKLMLYAVPGFITTMDTAMWAKQNLPRLEIVDMGEALNYAQEINPEFMAETISVWLQGVEQGGG